MVIKNKQTNKEYPISVAQWQAYPQRVKDLFVVTDSAELKAPQTQPVKNVVEKREVKKIQAPDTGNKAEDKTKHKK